MRTSFVEDVVLEFMASYLIICDSHSKHCDCKTLLLSVLTYLLMHTESYSTFKVC